MGHLLGPVGCHDRQVVHIFVKFSRSELITANAHTVKNSEIAHVSCLASLATLSVVDGRTASQLLGLSAAGWQAYHCQILLGLGSLTSLLICQRLT